MVRPHFLLLACTTATLLWSSQARAHKPGMSRCQLSDDAIVLVFSFTELDAHLPLQGLDATRILLSSTMGRAVVTADGLPCQIGKPAHRRLPKDGIEVRASLACPKASSWKLEARYLDKFNASHRHIVEAHGLPVGVLTPADPVASFTRQSETGSVVLELGQLGVEHVLTGFDHLVFLLGLLLVAASLRQMLGIVTGFTLAHSLTLVLATLGVVSLPSGFVEPFIALSVAYVGAENFTSPGFKRRFAITFLLGLVHGFGFASALIELQLPADQVGVALVSFNVGVELGQAAVVLLVLPLLLYLRRKELWRRWGWRAGSVCVLVAGLVWFFERVLV